MSFRAAFTSIIRAVSRPYLIVPAAVVAMMALMSPPAIDDASAQGFSRMQSSRGGFGGGPSSRASSMQGGMMNKSGRRAAVRRTLRTRRVAMGGMGMGGGRYPSGDSAEGGMGGMGMGGGRYPSGDSAEGGRNPKGDQRHPRLPRRPIHRAPDGRRHPGRTAARSAVERKRRRWRPAEIDVRRTIKPAARQLGPLCSERGGGRGRGQHLAADHERADAPASPHPARASESAIQQHVDPPLADQQPPPGSGRGARAGGRRFCGPAEPHCDAAGSCAGAVIAGA